MTKLRQCRMFLAMETTRLLTVVENAAYLAAAKPLFSDAERAAVVDMIARAPECGDLIVGGGGIRKVRFGVGGRGKSGGARIIYLFHSVGCPAFLLTVFAKNEKANLTKAEANMLAAAARRIIEAYKRRHGEGSIR